MTFPFLSFLHMYKFRSLSYEFLLKFNRSHFAPQVTLPFVGKGNPPGGGGVLPYMGYIGMCRCEGYGFQAIDSRIGYISQSVWV